MNTIHQDIEQTKRSLSGETLRNMKKAARKLNVTVESLIWILTEVYENGHMRSRAYSDCPQHVILDGLVYEGEAGSLYFNPWRMTEKAEGIMNLIRS